MKDKDDQAAPESTATDEPTSETLEDATLEEVSGGHRRPMPYDPATRLQQENPKQAD